MLNTGFWIIEITSFSSAISAIPALNEKTKPILVWFKVPGSRFTVEGVVPPEKTKPICQPSAGNPKH